MLVWFMNIRVYMYVYYVCVCTCIYVHSLHGQNKVFCSVLFCSVLFCSVLFCLINWSRLADTKCRNPISVLRITVDNVTVSSPYIGHTDIVHTCSASNVIVLLHVLVYVYTHFTVKTKSSVHFCSV